MILLQAEDVQKMCMYCYSEETDGTSAPMCILPVSGDIMWHLRFRDLLSCPQG